MSPLFFPQCDIRLPSGEELPALYHMLMDVFPTDRPIIEEHLRTGEPFYTLEHHALFRGSEIIGSVGLMPMRIWLEGRKLSLFGIASVATPERFRGQGVARYLLEHCLTIVDRQGLSAVLYTDLPAVYANLGFVPVEQTLLAASASALAGLADGVGNCRVFDAVSGDELRRMAGLHAQGYPKFDGTLDREESYWRVFGWVINLYAKCRVLIHEKNGRLRGYARCEMEKDRLLLTELCYDRDEPETIEILLSAAARLASEGDARGSDTITLAFPQKHPAWAILHKNDLAVAAEPPGAAREVFMVRPASGKPLGRLAEMQWSMADKF